jgi:hypothetical protein
MAINSQTRNFVPQVLPAGVSDFVGLKEVERP